ncbi:hypothetical protein K474DRAFT_1663344 [Panus rudis PR-1116 ss-1]|nr:hypothetical protein K474DRAFT_1663344 [Panus rudis PR-1116 ss-1]
MPVRASKRAELAKLDSQSRQRQKGPPQEQLPSIVKYRTIEEEHVADSNARAALWSKRSVRAFAFCRKLEHSKERDSDEDDIVCVCNGRG